VKDVALEKLLRFTKQFIKLRTLGHLWNALKKLHYADVATLIEYLNSSERQIVFQMFFDRSLEIPKFAEIISEIKPEIAVEILSEFDLENIVPILNELSSDDATSLIPLFNEDFQIEILRKMKNEDAVDLQEQLSYPEESAGRIMSSDFLALSGATSASDAISAIQLAGEEVEVPFYLYVIDEEERLIGVVSLKQLILIKSKMKLKDIMNSDIYKVDVFTDQEEVASVVANYNLLAIPVVDDHNKLVGVVTVDDVIDIIHDEATEDIYKLAGVTQDYSVELGVGKSILKRMPWLFLSLLTTSLSAIVISLFKGTIEQFILIAVLMHIVPAIGGVVGNQAVAIMVREIVIGTLEWKRSRKILLKEVFVSIGNGIIIGSISSLVTYLVFGKWEMGLIFGGAIMFNLVMGALFGTIVPIIFEKLKIDPALASGIIVTMLTDVLGLFFFLGVSTVLLI